MLAKELEGVEGIVIAEVEADKHKFKEVNIFGYPTILLFPANSNDKKKSIEFEEVRDIENLRKFLKKNSKAYRKYLESKPEPFE